MASDVRLVRRDLVYALETARSRLAVAMAAESKTTPPERWRYYLETEHRMRGCIKELRRRPCPDAHLVWARALKALKGLAALADSRCGKGEAQQLCSFLSGVLEILEMAARASKETSHGGANNRRLHGCNS